MVLSGRLYDTSTTDNYIAHYLYFIICLHPFVSGDLYSKKYIYSETPLNWIHSHVTDKMLGLEGIPV